MKTLFAMPTPPATLKAPVVVLLESVVAAIETKDVFVLLAKVTDAGMAVGLTVTVVALGNLTVALLTVAIPVLAPISIEVAVPSAFT